jgi:hypothetical protein
VRSSHVITEVITACGFERMAEKCSTRSDECLDRTERHFPETQYRRGGDGNLGSFQILVADDDREGRSDEDSASTS